MTDHTVTTKRPLITGRSLVLGLAGIAIVVVAFFVTLTLLDYVSGHNRAASAKEQITQIISGFRSIYANKPLDLGNWATDITGFTINHHLMPSDMLPPGVNCPGYASSESCHGLGPWSGSVVRVASAQDFNGIVIVYDKLTATACSDLAEAVAAPNTAVEMMNINSSSFGFPPLGHSDPTSTAIIAACNAGDANNIQLLYGMK
jgi:hypothetical protein